MYLSRLVFILALFALPVTFGQVTTTGEIHGGVLDPSGAGVPDAEIRLVDENTGIEKSTVSARDGGFVFVTLQPGSTESRRRLGGFQTAVHAGVQAQTARGPRMWWCR